MKRRLPLLLLTVAWLLPGRLLATTITVTTTSDAVNGDTSSLASLVATPGPDGISLREAVIAANNTAAGAPHTILLPAGTYNLTIAGANEDSGLTGDLDVTRSGLSLVGAGAATTLIRQTTADRVIDFNPQVTDAFSATISGLTITGGNVGGSFGGGGIIFSGANAGSPGTLTIVDSVITGNTATAGPGGGIEVSPSGNLTVTDSTLSNNSASHASAGRGGGLDVLFQNGVSTLTLTRCTLSGNTAGAAGGAGGGLYLTGNVNSTYILNQCQVLNNAASNAGGSGGGLAVGGGALTATFCRVIGNLAGSSTGHAVFNASTGTATVNNNWWGANTGPATDALGQNPGSPAPVATTWLQLRHNASPNPIVSSQSTTLTATFLVNSAGAAIAAGNLAALIGLPITFHSAVLGALSNPQTTVQASGTATATFTAGATAGPGSAAATVDSATATAAITVNPLDYSVATAGGAIVITDLLGHSDTLTLSEPAGAGTIRFAAAGRSFRIDNLVFLSDHSGNLPLAGVSSITVNAAAGNDILQVGAFTGVLPGLTLNGGTGDDLVNFNGNLTFAPNASLDVNLQDDDAVPGEDRVVLAANANLLASGTGTITIRCSRDVLLIAGSILQTEHGALTVEANQQATPTTGDFQGVWIANGLIRATGTGAVTVKGRGGDAPAGLQYGVLLSGGGRIVGGTSGQTSVSGTGGNGPGNSNVGVLVSGSGSTITSGGAAVEVEGIEGNGPTGSAIGLQDSALVTTLDNGGDVTLIGNSMRLLPNPSMSAPADHRVTLRPLTAGVAIHLGAAADPIGGPLSLSAAELNGISTGTLVIGDPDSGPITLVAPLSPANIGALVLESGGAIGNTSTTEPHLTVSQLTTRGDLSPGASPGIFSVAGDHILAENSILTIELGGTTPGYGAGFHDQLSATGSVEIGANVTLSVVPYLGFTPASGDVFTIIARTGGSGTFAGLPEGATFSVNGVDLKISYAGGAGNDVTLSGPPPTAARLAYFHATAVGTGQVRLDWGTLVEVDTLGFRLDRATDDGRWERVTARLIPALGSNHQAQAYTVTHTAPIGVTDARYRLIEVDHRGQEHLLAEARLRLSAQARIERTPAGLRLLLVGTPGTRLRIESATDPARGPWADAGTVALDDAGHGLLDLPNLADPLRFYRWSER